MGAVWAYVRNTRRRLGDAITRPVWALVLVFAVSANLTFYVK
ncbi:MAG TPA: hypothetical protein VHD84_03620 [Candidatus Saccharimonadales bacterium]|nr:hypothetical protein [Candidatus Saccharimonadales bacterium]